MFFKDVDERINASNKLEYHVKMYWLSYKWLNKWEADGAKPTTASNAVEESHAVHARILITFLGTKTTHRQHKKTDVNAVDFYPSKVSSSYKPLNDPLLNTWRQKIGHYLLHLTTENLSTKISDFILEREEIARALHQPLKDFFEDTSASDLRESDRKKSLEWLKKLKATIA